MALFGADISNNNGAGVSIAQLQREGYSWIEAKVSEGDYFRDTTWAGYRNQAVACGMPVIGYHYAIASCAPAAQVATFVGNGGGNTVMIDFEQNSGTIADYWALVRAFNAAGIEVALTYLPRWYWMQIGSPDLSGVVGLISSNYPSTTSDYGFNLYQRAGADNGPGWAPYGGVTPDIWQFSDTAVAAGTRLDVNAYRGTLADLTRLLTAAPPIPAPPVLPTVPGLPPVLTPSLLDQLRAIPGKVWQAVRSAVGAIRLPFG